MKPDWNEYLEYKGEKIPTEKDYPIAMELRDLLEYDSCMLSKEHFKNSEFHKYLLNKERTKLIDKILNDN